MSHATLKMIGDVFLVLALIPALIFPIAYWRLADWKATPLGRHMMTFMCAMAVILVLAVVTALLGVDNDTRLYFRIFTFVTISALLWQRVIILFHVQKHPHKYMAQVNENTEVRPRSD